MASNGRMTLLTVAVLLFVTASPTGALQAPTGAQPAPLAPIEICGTDRQVTTVEDLSTASIALAADRRLFAPCAAEVHGASHQESRDLALLDRAAAALNDEHRRLAAQAFGRFGDPAMVAQGDPVEPTVGRLIRLLADRAPVVRAGVANAVGQALSGTRSDLRSDVAPTAAQIALGLEALEGHLKTETSDRVAAVILQTLGRMRLAAADLDRIEQLLVASATGSPERIEGAALGLEALVRRNARRPIARDTRDRLRDLSALGRTNGGPMAETMTRVRRLAMMALQRSQDTDITAVLEAAKDPDWQVRLVSVQMMSPTVDLYVPAIVAAFNDEWMNVRIEAIKSQAKDRSIPRACGPIVQAVADPSTLVSLQAMDSLVTECALSPEVIAHLAAIADDLVDRTKAATWHRGARALTALSRLAPDAAKARLGAASAHPAWQVRAAAASVAARLSDAATAVSLAADTDANVQAAAIDALVRMKSPAVIAPATAALESHDNQVVQSAAKALVDEAAAVPVLLASLRRLTTGGSDTSRDPRVALIGTLAELLGTAGVNQLAPWTSDWDTAVRAVATNAFTTANVPVPELPRQYRYPLQPSAEALGRTLEVTHLDLEMEDGRTVTMELLKADAPLTVARVVALAQRGYYDGLTFHRIVSNFVVQGGSPGANEYVGDTRFMRDEAGLQSHSRGAVGISTRGYDTGDAQLFIDLVDVPRLDHDYTVFARVIAGMDVVDEFLEGVTIRRVTAR